MFCVKCHIDWVNRVIGPNAQEERNARYIFNGESLCGVHLNIELGYPPDRDYRVPEGEEPTDTATDADGRETVAAGV